MFSRTLYSLALVLSLAYPLKAATYYVGYCHTGSFATISDAVGSSKVAAGSIIKVCPGIYEEQVIISKPLTLEGIPGAEGVLIAGGSSMAAAVSPISNTTFTPYVWITTGPVKIQDIAVDDGFWVYTNVEDAGFYFASGSFGILSHVSAQGFGVGASVWAENSIAPDTSVTVENSYLGNGILALAPAGQSPLLAMTITGNEISPSTPSGTNLADGIYLYEVKGTVSGNSIFGPRQVASGKEFRGVGIWDQSPDATVSNNNIMFGDLGSELPHGCNTFGIVVASDKVSVKTNKISGAECGIDLGCHVGTVSGNTINRAIFGLVDVSSAFSGSNTLHNITDTNDIGSCQ
jgi:hypothetical protein